MRVWLTGAVLAGMLFLGNGVARAERTATQRTSGQKSTADAAKAADAKIASALNASG